MTNTESPTTALPTSEPSHRRSKQREAIATYLHSRDTFDTAQEIHTGLREAGNAVGLATVYRTLQAMAGDNDVDVLRTESGEARYRRCALPGHHHHLLCRQCGLTVEVVDEPVSRWADEVAKQHGFSEIEHQVEVFGTCAACSAGR